MTILGIQSKIQHQLKIRGINAKAHVRKTTASRDLLVLAVEGIGSRYITKDVDDAYFRDLGDWALEMSKA